MAFGKKTFTWKSYTTNKAVPTIKWVQLVDQKEFNIVALDVDSETFVVYMAIRGQKEMIIDLGKKAQIEAQSGAQSGAYVGALISNKAPTEILAKYFNYSDVFSAENIAEFSEYTGINDHVIELEEGKQSSFGPIYNPGPLELETLKIYIETNLANSFIWPFKSPAGAPILFDRKPNGSFCLCVDYWSLNNIIIKN